MSIYFQPIMYSNIALYIQISIFNFLPLFELVSTRVAYMVIQYYDTLLNLIDEAGSDTLTPLISVGSHSQFLFPHRYFYSGLARVEQDSRSLARALECGGER